MQAQTVADFPESGRRELAEAVRNALGSFLGAGLPIVIPYKSERSALAAGIFAAALYALIPLLQLYSGSPRELLYLSWWGVAYFGLVVALTRSTSLAIMEIVDLLILPYLSEECTDGALDCITRNFLRPRIFMKSLAVASGSMLLSCVLLRQFHWNLCLWGLGFFILYFSASQATLTARFYSCFSLSLKEHSNVLFPLDPAASPAVCACKALARRILSYWLMVFVLVMSIMALPYIATKFDGTSLDAVGPFISAVVFIAGFFSFCFGSLVYLRFESDLRIAVDTARLASLSSAQVCHREISSKKEPLSDGELDQLRRLKETSDYLSRSGYLKGSWRTLATTLAAVLPPAVSMVAAVLSLKKGL